MIWFVVGLTYYGSTLGVVCLLCTSISRSVSSASPVSVRPPWRNDVNDSSSRKPAARMTSFTLRVMWVTSGIFVVAELLVFELVKDGSLNGDEIDTLISTAIASHQLAAEHARRAEWRKRAANAAAVFEERTSSC